MPRLNGTGPEGRGRMTGRGLGRCNTVVENNNSINGVKDSITENPNNLDTRFREINTNSQMGNFYRGYGRGFGAGRGFGGGRGRGFGFNGKGNRGNF